MLFFFYHFILEMALKWKIAEAKKKNFFFFLLDSTLEVR